jgi:predicted Zn finger-like uncharacterized protein
VERVAVVSNPMPEENYTRCPGCATVFRVTSEQLALRDGQVRCGQCKTVFDGIAHKVAVAPPPDGHTRSMDDAPSLAAAPGGGSSRRLPDEVAGQFTPTAAADAAESAHEDRFSSPPGGRSRRARLAGYAIAIASLTVLIIAQAAFHFRDAIVSHWPAARPALTALCEAAGCAIRPLRDSAGTYLSIEASDLQADPAHRGLLILTATLRNRATWPLAYPYLELTLTDAQDRVVVRRALAPADYAGGTVDLQSGIAPNSELALKLFIDASATQQAGYRLYLFYP